MNKYFLLAASALALASCSSDDFLGENSGNGQNAANSVINFGGEAGKITRGTQTGSTAATTLKKHFVVFGDKTNAAGTQAVYDHYDVKWIGDEADNKTQTNQHGWEYVGYTPNKNSSLATDAKQSIKYWDYSASEYNFAAFSLGALTDETDPYKNQLKYNDATGTIAAGNVKISQIGSKASKYTVEGAVGDITKLYISDRITAKPNGTTPDIDYNKPVQFNFRALKTLVRMGIFETVNGYSVKDVKFYKSNNTNDGTPSLYATNKNIPAGNGKATITFGEDKTKGEYNKALVEQVSSTNEQDITFGNLKLKAAELKEDNTTSQYLGRTSADASLPDKYNEVIPSAKIGALTLKVDYTLVSTDGSKEEIKVTGATAVVPAEYTKWQPNYSYTYIFKISDKTNGNTGDPTKPGLYPIVFDAVVTETENGIQNTITTEETPSITTYAKGNETNNEYKSTDNIYACVTDATTGKTAALYANNAGVFTYYAQLYKLITGDNITEAEAEAVINATDMTLGGKTLKKEGTYATDALDSHFVEKIDATDATDGVEISGNFFKFKVEAGTYVFAYKKGDVKSYKVIEVKYPQSLNYPLIHINRMEHFLLHPVIHKYQSPI